MAISARANSYWACKSAIACGMAEASPRLAAGSWLRAHWPRASAPLMQLAPAILCASEAIPPKSRVATACINCARLAWVLLTKVCNKREISADSWPNMVSSTLASKIGCPELWGWRLEPTITLPSHTIRANCWPASKVCCVEPRLWLRTVRHPSPALARCSQLRWGVAVLTGIAVCC